MTSFPVFPIFCVYYVLRLIQVHLKLYKYFPLSLLSGFSFLLFYKIQLFKLWYSFSFCILKIQLHFCLHKEMNKCKIQLKCEKVCFRKQCVAQPPQKNMNIVNEIGINAVYWKILAWIMHFENCKVGLNVWRMLSSL